MAIQVAASETSSKENRAKRLRILRKMSGLTRSDFTRKYNISASNFQNWEGPRYGGLTESAAIKFLECVRTEIISSSLEWLMYGSGAAPTILPNAFEVDSTPNRTTNNPSNLELPESIQNELNHFCNNNNNTLECILQDDSMQPYFRSDEVVAGVSYRGYHLASTIGKDCIILLTDGRKLLRHVIAHQDSNRYNLIAHNLKSKAADLVCYQTEIVEAAPVLWRRLLSI